MAIKKNQLVNMTFELKVKGEIIESNLNDKPMTFSFGSGQLIKGLEDRIADMNAGETKDVVVPCEEAYGKYDETLTEIIPIADFEGIDLVIGMVLEGEGEDGQVVKATVTDVTKDEVTMDYNHPFADCDLEFTVNIESIV